MDSLALLMLISSFLMVVVRNVRYVLLFLSLQGWLLWGLLFQSASNATEVLVIGLLTLLVKAFLLPLILYRVSQKWPSSALRIRALPIWGYLLGVVLLLSISHIMPPLQAAGILHQQVWFFYGLGSLFLAYLQIMSRKHVLSLISAFIAIENALVLVAASIAGQLPLMMEIGMLLDLILSTILLAWLSHLILRRFKTVDFTAMRFLRR